MRLHPLTAIILWAQCMGLAMSLNQPFYSLILCLSLTGLTLTLLPAGRRKSTAFALILMAVGVIVINPLVSQSGSTALLTIRRVPILGRIRITAESILYGCVMALKMISLSVTFFLFSCLTDQDEMFTVMSRILPKSTLLFSMTVNVVHRIRQDIQRVQNVLIMRGVNFKERKLFDRVTAMRPLLKVVILSALEGSLDRAEALHTRRFGHKKRTSYKQVLFTARDRRMLIGQGLLLVLQMLVVIEGLSDYHFYPRLDALSIQPLTLLLWGLGLSANAYLILYSGSEEKSTCQS